MEIKFAENDLVEQFSGVLESRDATRLTNLQLAVSLVAAEQTAMQTEHERLDKKYGQNSSQAAEAAGRVTALDQQHASLVADVIRAAIPTPALEAEILVVYGRVLDANGKGVKGAKVVATDTSGASLARSVSKDQGTFEVRVPLQSPKKIIKKEGEEEAARAPVRFQLVVSAKNLERPYMYPEVLTGMSGQLAYREIYLPNTSKSGRDDVVDLTK